MRVRGRVRRGSPLLLTEKLVGRIFPSNARIAWKGAGMKFFTRGLGKMERFT